MKRNTIATFTAVLTAAFAVEIKDTILNNLLRLTAKQVITPKFITEALKSRQFNFGGGGPVNFKDAYFQARQTTYYSTFWGKDHPDMHPSEETDQEYYTLRSVVMPLMRDQLESKNTMMDIYMSCRVDWKKALKGEGVYFQQSLLESVNRSISVLEKIKDPQFRKELQDLENKKNSAEEIVKQIDWRHHLELIEKPNVPADQVRDREFEEFARRCHIRGGTDLTEKYRTLAVEVRKDIETVMSKQAK